MSSIRRVIIADEDRKFAYSLQALVFSALLIGLLSPLAASDSDQPAVHSGTLPVDTIVANLLRKDQERARALLSAQAIRVYHLVYTGFPGQREAQMTVRATYSSPSSKSFEILSQSGSKIILDRVFKKLLDDEQDAAKPGLRNQWALNRTNYEFSLVRYEPSSGGGAYVLQVAPKSKNKWLYRGQIWVDGTDFAVTRIDAEPAENLSFWTKRSEFRHEYQNVQGFWLPVHNESVSYIRMGGRATLTIDYREYRINRATDRTIRASSPAFATSSPAMIVPVQ